MEKQIKLRLNGVEKTVAAIEKAGHNYVRLQDLRDGHIRVDYRKCNITWFLQSRETKQPGISESS